jgi:hypothetical protein
MILKGFGFAAFFVGEKAISFCIHLSCLICCLSVVRGEWSRLFCGHKGRNLPEVSITSFLLFPEEAQDQNFTKQYKINTLQIKTNTVQDIPK